MSGYSKRVLAGVVIEPVTLGELRAQLRLEDDHTLEDAMLSSYITASRIRAEEFCNAAFVEQTVDFVFPGDFPSGELEVPCDFSAVSGVYYYDETGAEQEVPSGDYLTNPGTYTIFATGGWPAGAISYFLRVVTAPPVDLEGVKIAILLMCASLYENRTEVVAGTIVQTNPAVEAHLYPYRRRLGI